MPCCMHYLSTVHTCSLNYWWQNIVSSIHQSSSMCNITCKCAVWNATPATAHDMHKEMKPVAVLNPCSCISLLLCEHLSQSSTFCVPKFSYHSVCCLIQCFLVRISIATLFTKQLQTISVWGDVLEWAVWSFGMVSKGLYLPSHL
jgi:hypothetical protein